MVIKIDELAFHWRWKWSSRPNQWEWGKTVPEYCNLFSIWKEQMVGISFPVDEGDYIDGFIGNLCEDIRLRLSKSRHRRNWSRLSDAFNAAKFEESMMLLEVAIKQFEAHMVFDKMPSQLSGINFQQEGLEDSDIGVSSTPTESPVTAANHQTVYSPIEGSCQNRNKINSIEGELELNSLVHSPRGITYEKGVDSPNDPANEEVEFSSMETGNQWMEKPVVLCTSQLDVPKVAYHLFDKLPDRISEDLVSLEQATTVDKEVLLVKSYDRDERLPMVSRVERYDTEIRSPLIDFSLLDEEEATMDPSFTTDEVPKKVTRKVFDELSESAPSGSMLHVQRLEHQAIEVDLVTGSYKESLEEVTLKTIVVHGKNENLKDEREEPTTEKVDNGLENSARYVFDEMTEPVPQIQQSSPLASLFRNEMKADSPLNKVDNQLLENGVKQPPLLKMIGINVCHHMLDELFQAVPVCLKSDASLFRNEGRNDYLSSNIKCLQIVARKPYGKVLLLVFDPGGSSLIYNGCDPFEYHMGCHFSKAISDKHGLEFCLGDIHVGNILKTEIVIVSSSSSKDKNCEEIVAFTKADCHPFESNDAEQDFDELMINNVDSNCTTPRWKAWPKVATVLGLMPLRVTHLPQSAAKLFSLVGLWAFRCLHLTVASNATVLKIELGVELDMFMQREIQAAPCALLWLVVHHLFRAKMQQPFVQFNRRRDKFVKANFTITSRASKCTAAPHTSDSAIDVEDCHFILVVASFVWDPGQSVIFIHILADKDVFEGKEERWEAKKIMRYDKGLSRLSRDNKVVIMRRNEEPKPTTGKEELKPTIAYVCYLFCFSVFQFH